MVHQRRDILDPFAKRRQAQRHHIQPIEQILAKKPLLHQMLQVLIGRRDDAHIRLHRAMGTDGKIFAILKNTKEAGLGLGRHVADLVEKQAAALRLLEASRHPAVGTDKGTFFVAEELRFHEIAGDCRHVDRHEWTGAP